MSNYGFILETNLADEICEILGTEFCFRLDARTTLESQKSIMDRWLQKADAYYRRPQVGYVIRKGGVNGNIIYRYIRPEFKNNVCLV